MIAYAATAGVTAAQSLIVRLNNVIIYPLITLGTAVAVLVFAWGVFQYVQKATDQSAHAKGAKAMMVGIIGFVMMLSAYGILNLVVRSVVGTDTKSVIQIPLPTP